MFGPMMSNSAIIIIVVIGDIHKLVTEMIQVCLCCVFVNLVLPSNL